MAHSQKDTSQDHALFREYARSHDPALREQLIIRYVGLVSYLARRFRSHEAQLDDLIQVGFVGLIKAIDRYDPERGAGFSSYAVPTILGEIRRYFRDSEQLIHLPRRLQELRARSAEEMARLAQELERTPSRAEVADALDASRDEVDDALQAGEALSLDAGVAWGPDDEAEPLGAALGAEDENLERSEDRATIAHILSLLSPRERIILYLRFYEGLSQADVARRLGISQMHVSRLEHRGIEKIKRSIEG